MENPIYASARISQIRNHNWVIFDLDGTISDYSHRKHFLKGQIHERHDSTCPDWDAFNGAALNDPIKQDSMTLVRMCHFHNATICIMTGRNAQFASITLQWLAKHSVPHHLLLMRDVGDFRSDIEVKADLYRKYIQGRGRVHFVLEDRDKVVEMWRGMGLTCLQVMKGEY